MKILDASKISFMCVGILLGGVLFSVVNVMADLNPDIQGIPQVIPYQGVLELNGQPVNRMGDQAMWIDFQIHETLNSQAYRYSQRIQVEVYQGRFTALIGPSGQNQAGQTVYLTDIISSSSQLYLGMILLGDNLESDDDDILMSNRQRLMSTPYAMWASGASQFTVQQDLNVGGTVRASQVQVNGQLSATGDLNTSTNLNVQGNINGNGGLVLGGNASIGGAYLALGINDGLGVGNRSGQRALVHETGDVLTLNYEEDFEGGVRVGSNLHVDGNLEVEGSLPNYQFVCQNTGWGNFSSCTTRPEATPPSCPPGYYFFGIAAHTQSDAGCGNSSSNRARVKSRCCK
jgi:cytoskeletal protein CcmA (bactofilin family)